LRSDLRTFGSVLDPEPTRLLRDELRWLADSLGAVRDRDVLLARLRNRAAALSASDGRSLRRAFETLETERARAFDELLATLRSDRYLALLDRLIDEANEPSLLPGSEVAAELALPPVVTGPLRRLAKQMQALGDEPADEELHAARIRTKRARYAVEAATPVLGKRARVVADAAAKLQDVLGEYRDAVAAERWLDDRARETRSVREAFAAGKLAGLERAEQERALARWRKAWKRLSRARPREWR
jgi:CHAD domain-containing protein